MPTINENRVLDMVNDIEENYTIKANIRLLKSVRFPISLYRLKCYMKFYTTNEVTLKTQDSRWDSKWERRKRRELPYF